MADKANSSNGRTGAGLEEFATIAIDTTIQQTVIPRHFGDYFLLV